MEQTDDGAIGSPGGTHPFAVDGDTVHFAWAHGGVVQYRRSNDCGVTWGHSRPITEGGTSEYPVSLELTDGVLHLIWPDRRNGGWELYHKRSVDGGGTWGEETRLTEGDLFRLGTTASGSTLHVAWASRSSVEPTPAGTHTWGEIYYRRSTDDGASWEPQLRLSTPDDSGMRPGIVAGRIQVAKLLPDVKGLQVAVVSTDYGTMSKHAQVWSFEEGFEAARLVWGRDFDTWEHSRIAVGAFDETRNCVVFLTWGGFSAMDARDGTELMRLYWEGAPGIAGLRQYTDQVITDLNGDGRSE